MEKFVFHNPTRILFGRDGADRVGQETAALGRRALLVYGSQSAVASGLINVVQNSLENAEVAVVKHGGVRANPLLSHVREGVALAKETNIDVVVAVGGGSVIDTGKAIRAGALVAHDVWKFFIAKKSVRQVLPMVCIPTLAGAGSEMNSGMVVTNEATGQKFGVGNRRLHPDVAILDPTLTFSVPPDQTAYGAVDAMSHVLEFYLTADRPRRGLQERFIEGLILTLMENCERAIAKPMDYGARAQIMWAAALALCGFPAAGLGRVGLPMHMIEHSLSALYDVPHGAGLAAITPGWLSFEARTRPQKIAWLATRVFGVEPSDDPQRAAEHGIGRLRAWLDSVGCPVTLSELGIPAADIAEIAENAQGLARLWRMKNYPQKTIETILEGCL